MFRGLLLLVVVVVVWAQYRKGKNKNNIWKKKTKSDEIKWPSSGILSIEWDSWRARFFSSVLFDSLVLSAAGTKHSSQTKPLIDESNRCKPGTSWDYWQ